MLSLPIGCRLKSMRPVESPPRSGAVEGNTPDGDIEPPVSEPDSNTNVGLVIGLIVAGGAVVLGGGAFGLTMLFKKK